MSRPRSLRPPLRALHRDVGYLLVGLTVVYALSGLAVNHIDDWDPNFIAVERTTSFEGQLTQDDAESARAVLDALGLSDEPEDVYRASDTELEILLPEREIFVDAAAGTVLERGRESRFFVRVANWLHLNRGKQAWTYIADGYAVLLLFLAGSGIFMIPGRKGLRGRGAVLVLLGAAIPTMYVWLSGGP